MKSGENDRRYRWCTAWCRVMTTLIFMTMLVSVDAYGVAIRVARTRPSSDQERTPMISTHHAIRSSLLYRKGSRKGVLAEDDSQHSDTTKPKAKSKKTPQQKMWNAYYRQLVAFYKEHKHTQVPNNVPSYLSLAEWIRTQRQLYRTGNLPQEYIDKLNQADFAWSTGRREGWSTRLQELKKFRSKKGHCFVSKEENESLYNWVIMQRYHSKLFLAGKKSIMTEARIEALKSVGFSFHPRLEKRSSWDKYVEKLKRYKEKYGDCNVPEKRKKYSQLLNWIRRQRQGYVNLQSGQTSYLTEKRIAILNELGFIWKLNDFEWNKKLERFRQLSEQYDARNATSLKAISPDLVKWMRVQQTEFSKYQRGTRSYLTKERIEALRAANFPLDDPDRERYTSWLDRFKQLRQYKEEHGSCHIPQHAADQQLALFVKAQRYHYQRMLEGKKCSITPERVELLNSIGFDWKAPPFSRGPKPKVQPLKDDAAIAIDTENNFRDANGKESVDIASDRDKLLRDEWRKRFQSLKNE